jgi:hypothetical protein
MLFASLLALPLLASGSLAAILNRDFAIQGCVGVTTVLNVAGGLGTTLLLGLYQTEGDCVVSNSVSQTPCPSLSSLVP